jgi:hypothetical protein
MPCSYNPVPSAMHAAWLQPPVGTLTVAATNNNSRHRSRHRPVLPHIRQHCCSVLNHLLDGQVLVLSSGQQVFWSRERHAFAIISAADATVTGCVVILQVDASHLLGSDPCTARGITQHNVSSSVAMRSAVLWAICKCSAPVVACTPSTTSIRGVQRVSFCC